jgi:adenine-specific DNA-methyltransferase
MNALDTLTPDPLTTSSDVLAGYRATDTFGSGSGRHRLICDDNLAVLHQLDTSGALFDFIFVDPPYNTGRTRDAYQNRFDTEVWQTALFDRLRAAQRVLALSGAMALTIDSRSLADALTVVERLMAASTGWWYQIITMTTVPSGSAMKGFRRSHEYIICIHPASGGPQPAILGDHWGLNQEGRVAGTVQWNRLLKSGIGHTAQSSPGCFYPVFIDRATGKVVGVGEPVSPGAYQKFNDPDPEIATCWPIRKDGSLGRWRVSADTARTLLERGFFTTGRLVRGDEHKTAIKYLTSGVVNKIDRGDFEITAYDDTTGAAIVEAVEDNSAVLPTTVWTVPSHNYSVYGSWLLRKLVPQCTFSHPKSIYAMEDLLRFYAADPDAKILDLYAGSGTVAHAAMLLNYTDGGSRDTVSVTLNELPQQGHAPGDKAGVFHAVLVPRMRAASTGITTAKHPVSGDYEFPLRGAIADGLTGTIEVLIPDQS